MIEKERIEAIKRDVDLLPLVKSRGINLKMNGKGYKGRCPFHADDKSPSLSVTPDKNLWQCFGCNTGGDVIRFLELFDKVTPPSPFATKSLPTLPLSRKFKTMNHEPSAMNHQPSANTISHEPSTNCNR